MNLALLLLALVAGGGEDPTSLPTRAEALVLSVRQLPHAPPGTWKDAWDPSAFPTPLKEHYGAALDAYQGDDPALALAHLELLLGRYPDFPAGLHLLAVVDFRLHRIQEAREALERFLVQAPEWVGRTRILGHALYELGEYAAARDHYQRVLEAAPDDVEALLGDALAAWRLGLDDTARQELEAVLEQEPDHPRASYWRARLAWEGGANPEKVLALVARARELAPFDPALHYLASQALLDAGREEEAREEQERFQRLDRLTHALAEVERRLHQDPLDPSLLREKLRLVTALGRDGEADSLRRRLIRLQRGR